MSGPRTAFARLEASPRTRRRRAGLVGRLLLRSSAAKRHGVATALLEAAEAFAAEHGAPALEGYAVAAGHPNIDAYTGYLPMFLSAGYDVVRMRPAHDRQAAALIDRCACVTYGRSTPSGLATSS